MDVSKYKSFIEKASELPVWVSGDFQTDYTGGYPTQLCWNGHHAWLQLHEIGLDDFDKTKPEKMCADFGVRDCNSIADFNEILETLGDDAYDSNYLTEEYDLPFLNENVFVDEPLC